ncbi:hypothetical protein HG263_04715 [Pseudoalteromonas sp. JBTF-M23]|uniref:Uncharacterized protein n=1 Tax=Pseudoalteromonas caenipelagi TaxID=2726988 RepID=A0A849V9C8_9GAMM|nr:hypothetical protein [Pseudoalteromonas caenipelagi]NOU49836.1 hypothetical protein [Pseudoalteromonas caenipelagi]
MNLENIKIFLIIASCLFCIWFVRVIFKLTNERRIIKKLLSICGYSDWYKLLNGHEVVSSNAEVDILKGIARVESILTRVFCTVDNEGIYVHFMRYPEKPASVIDWSLLSLISVGMIETKSIRQFSAELTFMGSNLLVVIPWDEKWDKLVPSTVGLEKFN